MSWAALTEDDVLSELNTAEEDAVDSVDASSKLDTIVPNVIELVRGYIQAGNYPLGAAGTIPGSLRNDAIAIARWKFLLAVPKNEQIQTPERKAANDDAIAKLEKISRQQFSIEAPTAGTNPATGSWNSENKLVPRTHPVPRPGTQFQGSNPNDYANPDQSDEGDSA